MLNLLPPIKKQAIEQDQLYHFIQRCCLLLVGCTIMLSAVMLVSRFIAKFVLVNVQTRSTIMVNAPDQAAITQQLDDVTTLSADLSSIQNNFRSPLPVLVQLFNHLPTGIGFSSVHVNYATNTLQVAGVAESREQLLQLSQMINDQPDWTNIKFPLQDFTQKFNIPFEFEVTLTTPQ